MHHTPGGGAGYHCSGSGMMEWLAALERANPDLANTERVKRCIVAAEPFTVDNELMTPTLKVRRHKVLEIYGAALEALY